MMRCHVSQSAKIGLIRKYILYFFASDTKNIPRIPNFAFGVHRQTSKLKILLPAYKATERRSQTVL